MCLCLESQFDSSILDRALIITRIKQLTSILPDREILTWEFFIQRFEGLAIESQLLLKNGESNFVHVKFKEAVSKKGNDGEKFFVKLNATLKGFYLRN
uniref:Uncharacterized protein n=1 Tax=Onchocerca flexuosa TaxID=387005 RepID=A0A183I8I1_9BILA|nr:unnamed protein product [Onchocerca flexuosa]